MSEKTELERHAVIEFCKAYNKMFKGNIELVAQCDPPLPDTKCALDGKRIFIEVAHVYGPPSDAKRLLGKTGISYPSAEEQKRARMTPLDTRIGQALVRILKKKYKKKYAISSKESVWLLVRNANRLWGDSDLNIFCSDITIPSRTRFERIWLLCGPNAEDGLIELSIAD